MQIDERRVGNVTVLDLKGKMTLGEDNEMLKSAITAVLRSGRNQILLNMSELPSMGGAGLSELARVTASVSLHHGKIKFVRLSKPVSELLKDSGHNYEAFDNEATALASFK